MSRIMSLSALTSLGVGGEAEVEEVRAVSGIPKALDCDGYLVLGRGTNVLCADGGLRERVVLNRLSTITFDGTRVYADGGVGLITLCSTCAERSLGGLEWACGIPGSVGGAIRMNAGAFGGSISGTVDYVDVFRSGEIVRLGARDCGFGYRTSGFTDRDFIAGAGFVLSRRDRSAMLAEMRGYCARRAETQPKGRSAGSIYKRADKPAGWYIERAGLKGLRRGGAVVSEKHANFILNDGTATAADVISLMTEIERRVYETFGVVLEREIKLVGEF